MSKFVEMRLLAGISVDTPRNWWVSDSELNEAIQTGVQAALDLTGHLSELVQIAGDRLALAVAPME